MHHKFFSKRFSNSYSTYLRVEYITHRFFYKVIFKLSTLCQTITTYIVVLYKLKSKRNKNIFFSFIFHLGLRMCRTNFLKKQRNIYFIHFYRNCPFFFFKFNLHKRAHIFDLIRFCPHIHVTFKINKTWSHF